MRQLRSFLVLGLALAFPASLSPAAPCFSDDYTRAREKAREILNRRCGECHDGDRPTAKPKPLAIFDLREEDFAARMKEEQFQDALRRLGSASSADLHHLRVFVDAELARRRARQR